MAVCAKWPRGVSAHILARAVSMTMKMQVHMGQATCAASRSNRLELADKAECPVKELCLSAVGLVAEQVTLHRDLLA
jgi:hypothetical protein